MKATSAKEAKILTDIPNIGSAMMDSFRLVDITSPADLKGQNPHTLYIKLNKKTGAHNDPCVLDVFMAAVDFMNGASKKPWWYYTETRKKQYPNI